MHIDHSNPFWHFKNAFEWTIQCEFVQINSVENLPRNGITSRINVKYMHRIGAHEWTLTETWFLIKNSRFLVRSKCFSDVCLLFIFLNRLNKRLPCFWTSWFNKIVLLLLGVGKSSLIKQYIEEMDPSEIAPTVGVSFSTFKIKLEDGKVKMQVE